MDNRTRMHLLYVATLIIEFLIPATVRQVMFAALTWPLYLMILLATISIDSPILQIFPFLLIVMLTLVGLILAYGPILLSIIAYLGFGGGHTLTQFALGARRPSQREMSLLNAALKKIVPQGRQRSTKGFSAMLVLDSPSEYLYLIGTTLYISAAAIRSRHLVAMLAHEVGHNHNGDGAAILALRRFILPLSYVFIRDIRDFSTSRLESKRNENQSSQTETFYTMVNRIIYFGLSLAGGGLGVWILSLSWSQLLQSQDYLADGFAVANNLRPQLVSWLEESRFYDTSIPFMMSWKTANELRLEQLTYSG